MASIVHLKLASNNLSLCLRNTRISPLFSNGLKKQTSLNYNNHIRTFAAKKAPVATKSDAELDDEQKRRVVFRERMTKALGTDNVEDEEDEVEEEQIRELREDETELKRYLKSPTTEPSEFLEYKTDEAVENLGMLEEYKEFAEIPFQYLSRNLGSGALPDKIKMEMYVAWRKDPKYWTLNNLAAKWHTTPERAYAIVVDKRKEHHQTIIDGRPLDSWHQEAFEKEFALFITDRVPSDQMSKQDATPHFDFLDADVDVAKGAYLLRKSLHHPGMGRVPPHELPEEPPKRFSRLQKVRTTEREILPARRTKEEVEKLRDQHNIPENGGKIIFVDSSPRRHPYTREIYVLNVDGSVRTANWNERRELLRPPTRLLPLQQRFESEIKESDEIFARTMRTKNEKKRNEPNKRVVKRNNNVIDVMLGNTDWNPANPKNVGARPDLAKVEETAEEEIEISPGMTKEQYEAEEAAEEQEELKQIKDNLEYEIELLRATAKTQFLKENDFTNKTEAEKEAAVQQFLQRIVEETPQELVGKSEDEEMEMFMTQDASAVTYVEENSESDGFSNSDSDTTDSDATETMRDPYKIPPPTLPAWFDEILGTHLETSAFTRPEKFEGESESELEEPLTRFEEDEGVNTESAEKETIKKDDKSTKESSS